MPNTYLYIRFSDGKQEDGTSYDRQLERARSYCRDKNILLHEDEDHVFFDSGKSAYKGEHLAAGGELKRFYDLVAKGTIPRGSRLLVEDLDRLSRQDMWKASDKFRELVDAGILVVTLMDRKEWTGLGSFGDAMQMLIKLDLNNQESAKKSDRVGKSWTERYKQARNGQAIKIPLASWLTYGPDGFAILKEPEAGAVRLIFEMCIDGHGMISIAKELMARGHKPFRGSKWITASVFGIVKNQAAMGVYTPRDGGEPVPDYFEAVVDNTTWWAAQAAIAGRKKARATLQTKSFNVWQGIARCYYCNSTLHCLAKGRKKQQYLVCSGKTAGICLKAKNLRLDGSELVFAELLTQIDNNSLVEDDRWQLSLELSALEQQLAAQRQQHEDLGNAIARRYTRQLDDQAYAAGLLIDTLMAEKDSLESQLAQAQITQKNKSWFLGKLDLVSYTKRAQANALVKKLDIRVSIAGGESPTYIVRNGKLKDIAFPNPHPNGRAIIQISDTEDGIVVLPLTHDQRVRWHELQPDDTEKARINKFIRTSIGLTPKPSAEN